MAKRDHSGLWIDQGVHLLQPAVVALEDRVDVCFEHLSRLDPASARDSAGCVIRADAAVPVTVARRPPTGTSAFPAWPRHRCCTTWTHDFPCPRLALRHSRFPGREASRCVTCG